MKKPEQPAATGAGPLFERIYCIDIAAPRLTARQLMQHIKCNVEHYSPDLLAEFEKTKGHPNGLEKGDEFSIKILGPWNGTVRVTETADDHFELITLENHPEAGRIRFSLRELPAGEKGRLRFEIHSWARSRDGLVAFTYDTLGIGKTVQQQTWELFCAKVAEESGGQAVGPVSVETIKHDDANPDQ
ncbi:protein of unknown function [Hymenobacter daecheongensis DSM 21074]|uniref:DUF1990 domain-containing protein n=1 Tax=Hymenobacter daecheongensis DSM 21074 TaxID=1121955 RepID=A0A1M6GZF8_9BACT|nr:DUF1990 family protein [Hymenobacter daecheongensis]SHJ15304.1 protein of unknown function [Hymenobacter daecheongensis DSM 21074]